MGVRIAIDDFGTAYSSLPASEVKVGRGFVAILKWPRRLREAS
jgi:predicted signal transduction protein with EAL and GGDEF domain